jgi:hypothetical protein
MLLIYVSPVVILCVWLIALEIHDSRRYDPNNPNWRDST